MKCGQCRGLTSEGQRTKVVDVLNDSLGVHVVAVAVVAAARLLRQLEAELLAA